MVAIDSHHKLTRLLELELLKYAAYELPLTGYSLIALMPVDPNSWVSSKTLLVSTSALDRAIKQQFRSRWDITYDIQLLLKQGLQEEQYLEIYSIDILEKNSSIINQVNSYLAHLGDGEFEAPIQLIGGTTGQTITIIRSSILSKLAYNRYSSLGLADGRKISGKLIEVKPIEADAELTFQAADYDSVTCRFTDIISLDFQ